MYDVIVVGGGIIGSSVAWQLTKKGQKVLVIERKDSASGSAGATDGVVGYHTKKPGVQLDLAVQSIAMFKTLEAELGMDIEFEDCCGGMQPVEDKDQWDILSAIVEEQKKSGVDIRMISAEEACALEPNLNPDIYGALYCPHSCGVNPIKLTFAYRSAAVRGGAEYMNNTEVTAFIIEDGCCKGVVTPKGEFRANYVVNCCGSWAGETAKLAGLDVTVSADAKTFTDAVSIPSWAADAMQWAADKGIVKGDELGNALPNASASRAEVAAILMRLAAVPAAAETPAA